MNSSDHDLVAQAVAGDDDAFAELVKRHQGALKSYLYRLAACREDAEDLAQEVWIQVFTRLGSVAEQSGVRTWLFAITTDVARGQQHVKRRWPVDAQDKAKALTATDPQVPDVLDRTHWESPHARYEIREHVDFCFTCILKSLPLEEQLAFMLCNLYDFSHPEAAEVLGCEREAIEPLLRQARTTLSRLFTERCALINPQGGCHQCPELNAFFNPHQVEQQELAKLDLVRAAQEGGAQDLLEVRLALVRDIDPLNAAGTNLHEVLMQVVRQANSNA